MCLSCPFQAGFQFSGVTNMHSLDEGKSVPFAAAAAQYDHGKRAKDQQPSDGHSLGR